MISAPMLFKAMQFWKDVGYGMLSAPMLVEKDIVLYTLPKGKSNHLTEHLGKYYVASAEQSFLQMERHGFLHKGKYQAITPCVRSEQIDEIHQNIFLKLELIDYQPKNLEDADKKMAKMMQMFLQEEGISSTLIKTKIGWDVEVNGVEVGSYGYRKSPMGVTYIYGTGLAEPRTSIAIGSV